MAGGTMTHGKHEVMTEVVKATPPVGVTGAYFAGYDLPTIVAVLTIVYISLQIAVLLYEKVYLRFKEKYGASRKEAD